MVERLLEMLSAGEQIAVVIGRAVAKKALSCWEGEKAGASGKSRRPERDSGHI